MQESFLRRGLFPTETNTTTLSSPAFATTASVELLNMGFLAETRDLQLLSQQQLLDLVASAARLVGADRTWKPLYPGFPQEVIEAPQMELFINAVTHYLTAGVWRPQTSSTNAMDTRTALPIEDFPHNPKQLRPFIPTTELLVTEWERAIAFSKDTEDYVYDLSQYVDADLVQVFRTTHFRNGENFITALAHVRKKHALTVEETLRLGFDTARNIDDVLRSVLLTFNLEPGREKDLLCAKTKPIILKPVPRRLRKLIVQTLAQYTEKYNLDLLVKRRKLWQEVMRWVHPYDVTGHKTALLQLDIIHNNVAYKTQNADIEFALSHGDIHSALTLLETTPGNFVRRIDHILRIVSEQSETEISDITPRIIQAITASAKNVRLSTLISSYNGLNNRNSAFVVTRIPGRRNILRQRSVRAVHEQLLESCKRALLDAMTARLQQTTPPTSPVPTDNAVPVQLVQRDAAASLNGYSRGERIPLPEHNILRLFVHWYGRDVDLGVLFTDADMTECLAFVDYTNFESVAIRNQVTHSGDIVSAPHPNGACEFIDIVLSGPADEITILHKLPEATYAIMNLISYAGGKFNEIDNIAGVMTRNHGMEGEMFEPRTVHTAMSTSVRSTNSIPLIVNLKNREMIWLDTSQGRQLGAYSSDDSDVVETVRAEVHALRNALTVGELMTLWAAAHGAPTTQERAEQHHASALLQQC